MTEHNLFYYVKQIIDHVPHILLTFMMLFGVIFLATFRWIVATCIVVAVLCWVWYEFYTWVERNAQ